MSVVVSLSSGTRIVARATVEVGLGVGRFGRCAAASGVGVTRHVCGGCACSTAHFRRDDGERRSVVDGRRCDVAATTASDD